MKMIVSIACILLLALATPLIAEPSAVDSLLQSYRGKGAGPFSAVDGGKLWKQSLKDKAGQTRACPSCHLSDLTQPGRHVSTGKSIAPLAPSANSARLTNASEIEKWFLRNCKWTLGRECSSQEKGDLLSYLRAL